MLPLTSLLRHSTALTPTPSHSRTGTVRCLRLSRYSTAARQQPPQTRPARAIPSRAGIRRSPMLPLTSLLRHSTALTPTPSHSRTGTVRCLRLSRYSTAARQQPPQTRPARAIPSRAGIRRSPMLPLTSLLRHSTALTPTPSHSRTGTVRCLRLSRYSTAARQQPPQTRPARAIPSRAGIRRSPMLPQTLLLRHSMCRTNRFQHPCLPMLRRLLLKAKQLPQAQPLRLISALRITRGL